MYMRMKMMSNRITLCDKIKMNLYRIYNSQFYIYSVWLFYIVALIFLVKL